LKSLYLLRHAKSSWDDPGLADHDRPLAPRGLKAAQWMGNHMRRAKIAPDLVLCSTATRAVQTLDAISAILKEPLAVSVEDDLYGAGDTGLLVRLQDVPDAVGAVLLVGHNPGLQDLALMLAGDGDPGDLVRLGDKFPTCALATLEVPTPWESLGPGHAYLTSLVFPRGSSG
jgi:phosphohistidine phosphatase